MAALVLDWRRIALRGAAAGCLGGVILGLLLLAAGSGRHMGTVQFAEFVAFYAAVCIGWGIGYVYLAATRPQINRLFALSGLTFGAVVYVVTQLALYGIAAEQTHTAQQVGFGILATCLFFGLPVALAARLFEKAR
jgi:hypothetical protein